jgi:amidase
LYYIYCYRNWVNNPQLAKENAEAVTRRFVGSEECPIEGIPNAK